MPTRPQDGAFGSFIDGVFTTIGLVHFITETTFSHFFDLTKNNLVISGTYLVLGTLETSEYEA